MLRSVADKTAYRRFYAQRVIAAMEEAERNGQAAVTVDGKMVDYANLRMIRRLMSFKGQA